MDGISIFVFVIGKLSSKYAPFHHISVACTLYTKFCLDFNWYNPSFPFSSVLIVRYPVMFYVSLRALWNEA